MSSLPTPHVSPIPFPGIRGGLLRLSADVVQVRLLMANVYLLGKAGGDWVLVDAALPGTARLIQAAAEQIHGKRPPSAILLTHGHTDHVGALPELLKVWDVPVYAHPLELPYLTGNLAYTGPNPKIKLPIRPSDFRPHIQPLPEGGTVPFLPGWRWIHTPGHAVGLVALWNEQGRTLIAGDSFGTVEVTSPLNLFTGRPSKVSHAVLYTSREEAKASIGTLAALSPVLVGTGHGMALKGEGLGAVLQQHFETFDVPKPKPQGVPRVVWAAVGVAAVVGLLRRKRA